MGYDRFMSDEEFEQRLENMERRHAAFVAHFDQTMARIDENLSVLERNSERSIGVLYQLDRRVSRLEGLQ